ncbi:MAG: hypothetical protein JEZ03_05200 [Bacteroidales bacterium]|nr:hypothetical protein [Bacteroidales bacterium]
MKILTTYVLLAISFSAIGQIDVPITESKMLTADSNIIFEHFQDVQVFQFFDSDSLNGKITHSEKLDSNGNVTATYFKDHKTDKGNGRSDVLILIEYNEKNQLVISTSYYETYQKDVVQKSFFYYNDSLLARVETFELKKRLKSDVDKGLGRPGGCIVLPEDFEKEQTWKPSRIVLYKYDSLGRKKLSYSPLFKSSHNRFEYQYDAEGNLILEKSLDESRLLYTINYQYKLNKTISNLQWDNKDWDGTKRVKTFDNNGNLIKESTIQNDKEWVDEYQYNIEDKLVRFTAYDSDGGINLTHIYKYNK